jgi:hypothetical protein
MPDHEADLWREETSEMEAPCMGREKVCGSCAFSVACAEGRVMMLDMTTATQIQNGTRVHWMGDFSNLPRTGTVVAVDGAYMLLQWDGESADQAKPRPVMLLSTPRWKVVG